LSGIKKEITKVDGGESVNGYKIDNRNVYCLEH